MEGGALNALEKGCHPTWGPEWGLLQAREGAPPAVFFLWILLRFFLSNYALPTLSSLEISTHSSHQSHQPSCCGAFRPLLGLFLPVQVPSHFLGREPHFQLPAVGTICCCNYFASKKGWICCPCEPGLEAGTTLVSLQAAVLLSLLSSTKGIQLQAWPGQQGNGEQN